LAESGQDVVIAHAGKPVARLTSLEKTKRPIHYGVLNGRVRISADFDAPLPADVLADFEG
jgi:antitoxin (DNA-binding transcriptional repressor) of toxin-antitoxin stability system